MQIPGTLIFRASLLATVLGVAAQPVMAQSLDELRNLSIDDLANVEVTSV